MKIVPTSRGTGTDDKDTTTNLSTMNLIPQEREKRNHINSPFRTHLQDPLTFSTLPQASHSEHVNNYPQAVLSLMIVGKCYGLHYNCSCVFFCRGATETGALAIISRLNRVEKVKEYFI
ncbi:unnamed protein product [Amoebophrya sp. A120]|nr:unnamed protein product [Amoebophrya sp. A120]|eukprot:GSA120T00002959001.1